MRNAKAVLAIAALCAAGAAPVAAQKAPVVVASIPPIHSLVANVMAGVAEPILLVPGGASPHSFALRPSAARQLEAAQIVFRVGPTLESFLTRPLETLARNAVKIDLIEAAGVRTLPFREGGIWEPHHHDEGDHDHTGAATENDHDREHRGPDPHVWLDPINAVAMTRAIADALSRADTPNAARYAANAARLAARIEALDGELEAALAAVGHRPYFVFHDGYQYFEKRYGLRPAGAITVSPDQPPSARRIAEIRARIRTAGPVCVFAEPQFEPRVVATLIEGTDASKGVLDPLGAALSPGPDAYFTLMRNMAGNLARCLRETS